MTGVHCGRPALQASGPGDGEIGHSPHVWIWCWLLCDFFYCPAGFIFIWRSFGPSFYCVFGDSSAGQLTQRRFHPRQVHAAEIAGDEGDEYEEEAGDDTEPALDEPEGGNGERSLEEVLQTEVENLAEVIAQAEEEGVDPMALERLRPWFR